MKLKLWDTQCARAQKAVTVRSMVRWIWLAVFLPTVFLAVSPIVSMAQTEKANNPIMGELRFKPAGKVEKTSGVWIDGQYVGFVDELKNEKKVLLLPGEHAVSIRQSGYTQLDDKIVVEPGQVQTLAVRMSRDPRVQYSSVTAEVKLLVTPDRAAVFLDNAFVGHVHEFGGVGRAMLVNPGQHHIKIELPGYVTFETEVNLLPKQKFEVKADMVKGSITEAGALIKPSN